MLRVVRRLHLSPEMGSPAVSCRISSSIREMTSGVFFPPAYAREAIRLEVLFDEFTSAFGHGVRVHADELGHPSIPAIAEFERFQPGVETALPFVEQAEEQHNRRLQLVRHLVCGDRTAFQLRLGVKHSTGQQLALAQGRLRRTIQIQTADRMPRHALLLYKLPQRLFGPGMQQVVQFLNKIARCGIPDKRLSRIQQGAPAGEPDRPEGPQTIVVEARGFIQRVVRAAMRVTGPVSELLQLAENRDVHICPQRFLQLGHGGDFAVPESFCQIIGMEGLGSHNVRCLLLQKPYRRNSNTFRPCCSLATSIRNTVNIAQGQAQLSLTDVLCEMAY